MARLEERKFLGFSISNDGSERRIAPKALDKFKGQIRDMTRPTRGFSLQQLIKELKPYIVGWRGYFGFCQTPRVLTNLEAWIRRRLRLPPRGGRPRGQTGPVPGTPVGTRLCAALARPGRGPGNQQMSARVTRCGLCPLPAEFPGMFDGLCMAG